MTDRVAGLSLAVDVSSIQQAKKALGEFKLSTEQAAAASHEFIQQEYLDKKKRQDAARAIAEQRKEVEQLRTVIDPTVSALKRLSSQADMLERAFGNGLINEREFMRLNGVLAQTNAKLIEQRNALTEDGRALNQRTKDLDLNRRKGEEFISSLESQIAALGKNNQELQIMKAQELGVSQQAIPLINRLRQATEQINAETQALNAEAAAKRQSEKAAQSFIKQLQWQAETAGKTRIEILELQAAQLGVSQQAAPMIASLKNQTKQLGLVGVTAGQYRNAMRMLPAQITDVVTSLASGMPIWMVAIQQGGQIKDSFGGIGNTFKMLKNVINPVTLAFGGLAAALGGIAYATYDYYKQTQNMNKAIAKTGGYAYQTAGELQFHAERIAEFTNTSVRSTQKLMTELAGNGKMTQRQLEIATVASQKWAKASGDSASEFAKNFEGMTKKPVQALAELNEAFKFLEPGQLTMVENIRKTKGETAAATKAFEIFASTMVERSERMEGALSPLETAWDDFFNWVSDGWTRISEGFAAGGSLIVDTVKLTVNQIKYILNQGDILVGEFFDAIYERAKDLPGFDKMFGSLAQGNKQMVENAKRENSELAKTLDQLADRVNEGEQGYIRRSRAAKLAADKDQKTREKNAESVRKEAEAIAEANRKKGQGAKYRVNEGSKIQEQLESELLALQAQLKVLKEQDTINERISQQRKTLWNEQAKIAILEQAASHRKLTDKEKEVLANKKMILDAAERKAAVGDEIVQQERLNKLRDESVKYINKMTAATSAMSETADMGSREKSRYEQLLALRADYLNKGGQMEDAELARQEEALRANFAMQDQLRGDWLAGMKTAFADFGDSAMDMNANLNAVTTAALNGLSSQLTDFLTTGKANFADFATSIIKMIVEMIIKMMIFNALSAAFGGGSAQAPTMSGLGGGGGIPGFANGGAVGFTGNGGKYEPAGVVHGGEFVFTKESTKRIGADNLNRLMRGYANGGVVGSSGISTGAIGSSNVYDFSGMNISLEGGNDQVADKRGFELAFAQLLTKHTQRGGVLYPFLNKSGG